MVLSTVEAHPESTEFVDQGSAEHGQVVAIVLAAETFRRPVGLGEPVVLVPSVVDLGLIAVQEIDIRFVIGGSSDLRQGIGGQLVVMIEERQEVPGREVDRTVRRRGDPFVER